MDYFIPGLTEYLSSDPAFASYAPNSFGDATVNLSSPSPAPSYNISPLMPNQYDPYAYSRGMYAQPTSYLDQAMQASFGDSGELSSDLEYALEQSHLGGYNYSPEALSFLDQIDAYLANEGGTPYDLYASGLVGVDPQTNARRALTNEELLALAQNPLESNFAAKFNLSDSGSGWDVGDLYFRPDEQYRLIDRNTGEVLYSGTGYDAGAQASQLANQLFSKEGQKANWEIQKAGAGSEDWTRAYEHKPEISGLGTFLSIAAPIVGAGLAPLALPALGLGGLGGAATAGIGSALGSAAAGTAMGRPLEDILKSAALSGAGAYAGASLLGAGAPADAASGGAGGAAGGTAAGAAGAALDPTIVVQGALGGAGGGALGGGLGGALASAADPTIVVQGQPSASYAPAPTGTIGALAGMQPGRGTPIDQIQNNMQQATQDEIVVTAKPITGALPAPGLPASTATPRPTDYVAPPEETIRVTANQPQTEIPSAIPAFIDANLPNVSPDAAAQAGDPNAAPEKSTLDKIIDYLRIAGLGIGLGGSLLGGGGGRGGANLVPAGFGGAGGLSNVFNRQLPSPSLPGLGGGGAGAGMQPRTAADLGPRTTQDWYRYGYGPEQSFFNYVPTAAPNTSRAYTGYAEGGQAEGDDMLRDSFAVNGPGTGRSDEIPALLSDGEYVIDAETVALLGDGSSKAGADKLDQFRVNVRKHKGKQLAKGEFSANAKRPEKYLHGGRA